jgi:hypothetical protein
LAAENILYPELAAHGQLSRAIQAAANELAVDLGPVVSDESDPRRSARVGTTVPGREPMSIGIGVVERWFVITGWSRGVQLVSGATPDLAEVVRAAAAWRSGATLSEIQEAATFVNVSDLARAHERGPADAVAEKWRLLRLDWSSDDRFRYVFDIIEAAFAVPALRQLFPYTSHAYLCFSRCTGFPYSDDIPIIDPSHDGGYVVRDRFMDAVIGEADTAEGAIAILVANLPPDLGPARAGTADLPT